MNPTRLFGLMPPDVSVHGPAIDRLLVLVHAFMAVLFVGWAVFLVVCLVSFRARPGHRPHPSPPRALAARYLEVGVVVIEAVLLFGISTPVWFAWKNRPPEADKALHVRVVAEQFNWNFQYPGNDRTFGRTSIALLTDSNPLGLDAEDPAAKDDLVVVNALHVPVHVPVVLEISSKDVIHAFNVPALRVKQDAIPGQRIPIWFEATQTGTYEIACAQLCGLAHYRMRGELTVDTPEDYARWFAAQEAQR